MIQRRGKRFARVLVLSLVVGGWCSLPQASAAGLDATATVTVGGGTYNSIKVSSATQTRYDSYICGIYNSASAPLKITMDGEKIITVTDTGMSDTNDQSASAAGIGGAEVIGEGAQLTVQATGGTVGSSVAYAIADACGVHNSTVGDNATITVTATGGTAKDTYNIAYATASGVHDSSKVGDNATIKVTAIGGTAMSSNATAYGVHDNSTVGGNAVITVTANGGIVTAANTDTNVTATAYGVQDKSKVGDNATITVQATGGEAASSSGSAEANGEAYGVRSSSTVGNNAVINVTATGGKSTSRSGDATAFAFGVCNNSTVGDNAVITVTANGGEATSSSSSADAFAYGVQESSAVGDNAVITVTANGGVAKAANAHAYAYAFGMQASNGGTVTLRGAAKIISKAEVQTSGAPFGAFSLHAEGERSNKPGTNNFIAVGKTKILEGDVYAGSYGTNNLVLDTADSYLQGNIGSASSRGAVVGNNNITISNGAVWRPVYDNRYGTDCDPSDTTKNVASNKVAERKTTYDAANKVGTTITLNQDGIIDLTWDGWTNGQYDTTRAYRTNGDQQSKKFRSLTVGKLDGADGIVKVDSDLANNLSDTITVGADSTATSLRVQVNYDDFYANSKLGETVTGLATVVTDNSGKLTVTGTESEYNERIYAVQVEKDADATGQWNIT